MSLDVQDHKGYYRPTLQTAPDKPGKQCVTRVVFDGANLLQSLQATRIPLA